METKRQRQCRCTQPSLLDRSHLAPFSTCSSSAPATALEVDLAACTLSRQTSPKSGHGTQTLPANPVRKVVCAVGCFEALVRKPPVIPVRFTFEKTLFNTLSSAYTCANRFRKRRQSGFKMVAGRSLASQHECGIDPSRLRTPRTQPPHTTRIHSSPSPLLSTEARAPRVVCASCFFRELQPTLNFLKL